ncbi:cytidylyltransferase domain-containing protein [Kordiimonas aestuarii]|uniref:cytidylyltransferase domain-containing protein n=1 Tax=Kordiimonas aestuarii TaxID=1005925 RepID=UPI0021D0C10B|nr:NTP transferase domain-containing protein [Kordiimonas aestuarii]
MAEKIVAIVGARLNSSRLPGKQLLPLAGKPMIARIVDRLRTVPELDQIILATTADDYNRPLRDWAASYGVECLAYDGDVNDLVGRVDKAAGMSGASQILYICGDCPLIEPATLSRMIAAMAATPGAGLVKLRPPQAGKRFIHEGFDLYARAFWQAMEQVAFEPFEREHIGAVYHHLNKVQPAAIAWVDEPEKYTEVDHRISVDTPSDYRFMRRLYTEWYHDNPADSLLSLDWVMDRLMREPELASMNKHVHQKMVGENSALVAIITEAGPSVGMGHLSRCLAVAAALQDYLGARAELFIMGEPVEREELKLIPHQWLSADDLVDALDNRVLDGCVVDVQAVMPELATFLGAAKNDFPCVGIDTAREDEALFDHIWVPSFYGCPARQSRLGGKLSFGWDHFLLPSAVGASGHADNGLIVLTGGGDVAGLGQVWPPLIEARVTKQTPVSWVQGPYAAAPDIGDVNGRWHVLKAPSDLPDRLSSYRAALCVFGVSFFECLQADIPVVTFDPVGAANPDEWQELKRVLPDFIATNAAEAVNMAASVLAKGSDENMGQPYSREMRQGPRNFALCLADLMQGRTG